MASNSKGDEPVGFHYPMSYPLFRSQLNIVGESYETICFFLWYFVRGGLMRKIVVDLGRIRTDLRLSAFIAKPPGHGGSAFKNSIIRMLRGIVTVCLPTSRHEEQLVGKTIHVIVKGIEKVRKNFGYCKEASVIFDEALPLIVRHDDRYDKFWGYMNTALDTYGENLIEKRAKRYELAPGYLEACDLCRYYDEKLQEFCLSLFQLIRSRKFTYVS